MKRKTKNLVIAISSLLLCAGLGGGALVEKNDATADEAMPQVSIVGHNLALEDTIHIQYAVDTENFAATDTLGLLVWTKPQTEYLYGTQDRKLSPVDELAANETTYPVFHYTGLAAKQMTDVLYSRAFVERNGEYYYSEVSKYSVLEYAYNKLGKTEATPTTEEELKTLLNALLSYGGAAQAYFDYKEDALASDGFTYVRVENATFADGFDYGLFKTGGTVEVFPNEGYALSDGAAEYFSTSASGEILLTVPKTMTVDTTSIAIPQNYSQGLAYALNADGASYSVTDYTGTETEVYISPMYNRKPVTSIGSSAFSGCSRLTNITIPDSITSIGSSAFSGCSSLTNITVPDSVTSIGKAAFSGCSGLTSITLPFVGAKAGVTASDTYQYPYGYIFGTSSYTGGYGRSQQYYGSSTGSTTSTTYYMPKNLTSVTITGGNILYGAFYNCNHLTDIIIGEGVTMIGDKAFYSCSALTNVKIADSVISIGEYAFKTCKNLKNLEFGCNLTTIENFAFFECDGFTNIQIPDKVTSIGQGAFYMNDNLTHVIIGSGVKDIGASAFYYCSALETIDIGKGIQFIGENAFYYCSALNGVYIKDADVWCGVSFENQYANPLRYARKLYLNNQELTELVISEEVSSISEYAFFWCSSIISVKIPESVTSIGYRAFYQCSNLERVDITNLTAWCAISFNDEFSNPLSCGNNLYLNNNLVTELIIPEGIVTISSYAFRFCSSLTSVVIPDSVTSIGTSAFYSCTSLSSITYEGTVAEWNTLEKGTNWSVGISATEVVCSDGRVNL